MSRFWRRKLGKKLSPYQSGRYVVIERRGVTYYVRPVDGDSARVMRRHYDDLEAAPQQMLSCEESEDSGSCSDTERAVIRERPVSPRYPRRERRPTRRLQMDARRRITRSMTREHRGRRTIATVVIMIRTK